MREAGGGEWVKNSPGDGRWNACLGFGEGTSGVGWYEHLKKCAKKARKEREEEDGPLFLQSRWGEI